jgi:DNA-binding NarL/FixJ family response regulator
MKAQPVSDNPQARILLVDDHPILLRGLSQLINQEVDMIVCGETADAESALQAIGALMPNLVIVDISLKGTNGLELIKSAASRPPELPMLVLSMHNELLYAERALRAGASGYIMKEEVTDKLVFAIRRVLNGEIYLSERMSTNLLSQLVRRPTDKSYASLERLSDRELEIFQLIGQGSGTRQIADALHLSIKTVETHRKRIKEKLNLKNAAELVWHAVNWGAGGKAGLTR